ncbi:MAG TPA: class C beta-lactamase-related serine hydrolase [Gammaproteobacteria bacterium]|jgi:CubicO group peptidase (beta-lactamase class C family)|nr:class C beta-lactamase-related serine hydrolase [Gammaproteobacteria bacterium]HIK76794.1 class C beta-lactamase-related serine hydrolase [Gammaproteobacteria bacterium]
MKTFFKIISSLILLFIASLITYITYLYIQNPVVVSRLGGVIMGNNPGIPEVVKANNTFPVKVATSKSISTQSIESAIQFAEKTDSHALLIFHKNELQLEHYFPEYSKESITSTASMHKSVLAILIGIAIEQGYIESIDQPASDFLSEWSADKRNQITIRQMLQQSSGIDFPEFSFHPLGEWNEMVVGDDVMKITINQLYEKDPDTEFAYNGINPQNLGLILQRATGQRYSNYLSENFWQYLAEKDSYVILDSEENKMPRMFCCLDAIAKDWLRVGILILNKGILDEKRIVSESWIEQMTTPSKLNPNYGFLTWLGIEHQEQRIYNTKSTATAFHSEPFIDNDIIYFDGFGGQRVYIIPSKEIVIVRTGDIKMDWDDAKLPNIISKGIL